MRILFVVNRLAHVRHFDRAVRLLADRGHDICLASQDDDVELWGVLAGQPRITARRGAAKSRRRLDGRRDDAPAHARLHQVPPPAIRVGEPAEEPRVREDGRIGLRSAPRRLAQEWSELLLRVPKPEQKRVDALLAKLETAIPCDPNIHEFLLAQRPDAIVLSPMVGIGFTQADFVKSARALGIPSGMLVFSWDNLSNKGLIHEMPDRMFVWNDIQAHEAAQAAQVPGRTDRHHRRATVRRVLRDAAGQHARASSARWPGSIRRGRSSRISGRRNSWRRPSRSSSTRWISELRRSADPALAGCSLLIRPHPAGEKGWHADTLIDIRWPKRR